MYRGRAVGLRVFAVRYDALGWRSCSGDSHQHMDDARGQRFDVLKYNLILELMGGEMTIYRRPVCLSRNDSIIDTGYDVRLFSL